MTWPGRTAPSARGAERGRERPLMTKFGQVTVPRIAYRSPGRPNVHAADAALNLPEEKHSHGLRKMAAIEAARGSIEAACAAVTRATGVRIGKRQAEGLVRRAAMDVDVFYLWRVVLPARTIPLVLTFDGKGIVMLPDALRPATAKAAAAAESKLATRLSPGEKNGRKRMAELACVYDAVPVPRTPQDVISTPAQKRRTKKAQAAKPKGRHKPREPQARGKWLTASVTDDIPAVIAAAFDEAERRDPQHKREWVVLVDGNSTQIEAVTAEAAARGVTVTIVIDFIHVLEYLWKAAWSFFDKGEPGPRNGSLTRPARSCTARPARSRPASAAAPPPTATPRPSAPAPTRPPATWGTRRATWATPPRSEGLAHRHRDNRGRLQAHRKGQNGHNGREMGPRRRRGHPETPRRHRHRRLRRLLAFPPPPRARTHPRRALPRQPRPRSVTSSPHKSRTLPG